MANDITIIGGGLAGSEAAYQLLKAGLSVTLVEGRPGSTTPAHQSDLLGELVCSNSLRSDADETAPGLLKAELRQAGSLIMRAAEATRVPAGSALAVDRKRFAATITRALTGHPRFTLVRAAAECLPTTRTILASGPLTAGPLAAVLAELAPGGFHFYDAIAPILDGESINWDRVFRGARRDPEGQDYVNCPLDRAAYDAFVHALRNADQVVPHAFEEAHYFEGCLPIEVMAGRGDDVLAFGPLRPVGLLDPRSDRRPHAVVQLRTENLEGTCYNMVGFQTRLKQPEQRRVFRMIPGLEQASFLRYGSIHRNSYIDSPRVLDLHLRLHRAPHVTVAGQLSGVEGYIESTAAGLLAGWFVAAEALGHTIGGLDGGPADSLPLPPCSTAIGGLLNHVTRRRGALERFEPSNITFGLLPGAPGKIKRKADRRRAVCERALADFAVWRAAWASVVNVAGGEWDVGTAE